MRSIDLSGKTGLVMGVANQRSLGWAIADALGDAGMRLVLTYQGARFEDNVRELAVRYPGSLVLPCDVTSDVEIDMLFDKIESVCGNLHAFVHSIAFARREELEGHYRKTSREGWRIALEISAYSFVALADHAAPLMEKEGGSMLALSFQAAHRVFPNYNVMGAAKAALEHAVRQLAFEMGPLNVRVNAISAGPVATLSARGVSGFTEMVQFHREVAPLRRSVEPKEVGDAALFLCSSMASGITGTTLYVDTGFHVMGTPDPTLLGKKRRGKAAPESGSFGDSNRNS